MKSHSFPVFLLLISMSLLLLLILLSLSSMFSGENKALDTDSTFECGMDVLQVQRMSLHMHFFHVAILFLVFDLELVVLLPCASLSIKEIWFTSFWAVSFLLLLVGLVVEYTIGTVDWKKS